MQVVACIFPHPSDSFKFDFANRRPPNEPDAPHHSIVRRPRAAAMMAPVILVGAMLMFVLWDTSERH
jgi:hypothetical protein